MILPSVKEKEQRHIETETVCLNTAWYSVYIGLLHLLQINGGYLISSN